MVRDEENVREFEINSPTETVSDVVIEAVASKAGEDPLSIDPLHSTLDPDALDAIFGSKLHGAPRNTGISVTFSYYGYEVTVWSDGQILVAETQIDTADAAGRVQVSEQSVFDTAFRVTLDR